MKKTATKNITRKPAPKKPPAPARQAAAAVRAASSVTERLIGRDEPPPVRVENAAGKGRCVIVCDHASNLVPRFFGTLGLPKAALQKHIAWDPGTEDIGRYLSRQLNAPVVFATYSRLVVDLNRGHDHPECMRDSSDHIRIPGNEGLTPALKKQRLNEFFWPYHRAVDVQIQRYLDKGTAPVMLAVHSFTPRMDGFRRPWQIGVLWNKEERIALKLVESLRKNNPELRIGENEPYSLKSGHFTKSTVSTHAESRGMPYVIIEFRQDLVSTKPRAEKWAALLLESLQPILADPALYRLRRKPG